MQRAGTLIGKLPLPADTFQTEDLVRSAWPGAVGKKIAAHARAGRLVRARLVVEVEDDTWQRQLYSLRGPILRNLEARLGPGMVQELEFRVVPLRRGPRRAANSTGLELAADEAETISDPVLRTIYRAARKKAQA
ncbi:MAG: DUF721 domain-containing protein [Bryobacteraceae bacterium]